MEYIFLKKENKKKSKLRNVTRNFDVMMLSILFVLKLMIFLWLICTNGVEKLFSGTDNWRHFFVFFFTTFTLDYNFCLFLLRRYWFECLSYDARSITNFSQFQFQRIKKKKQEKTRKKQKKTTATKMNWYCLCA